MSRVRVGAEGASLGNRLFAGELVPLGRTAVPPLLPPTHLPSRDRNLRHIRAAGKSGLPPGLLENLQARQESIAERWAVLLYLEPINGPLANPDALINLIPYSLELFFAALAQKRLDAPAALPDARIPAVDCHCGKNPYRGYFVAGIQAVTESFILLQIELPSGERRESDLAAVVYTMRRLAASEINTFCGVCSYRGAVKSSCPAAIAPW